MKIFPITGESPNQFHSIERIDQDYQLVGNHIDDGMCEKIAKGQYVDFSKLLPKDRILAEENERLELVIRQGRTFWTPMSESITINSYNRWEQAFHIYSDIYTRQHPHRSAELIQYNHIIHSISATYTWENVYLYDREFRLHLVKHPERSWSVILQQTWSMRLKDCLASNFNGNNSRSGYSPKNGGGGPSNHGGNGQGKVKINDPCRRFNRGYCKFGANCRYEHHCLYCLKFGHTILT